jgi:hypothetical protein
MEKMTLQQALVDVNKRWLRQALDLLGRLDRRRFSLSPRGLAPHKVSSQLRHVIEFYECFLEGLPFAHVDYDARRRDESLEASIDAAALRICELIERLDASPALKFDGVLFVKMEDASAFDVDQPFMTTTTARELMALSSHTIHHFALIAMTLRAHGMVMDADFGVAPSTLRHRERQAVRQAAMMNTRITVREAA